MQIYTCFSGNTNQQFSVTADNRIAWTNKGECLDLTDGLVAAGQPVSLCVNRQERFLIPMLGATVEMYRWQHESSMEHRLDAHLSHRFFGPTFL